MRGAAGRETEYLVTNGGELPIGAPLLGKNVAWGAGSGIVSSLVGLASGIILGRMLGPGGMGEVSYVLWLVGLVAVVAGLGLDHAYKRFLAELTGAGRLQDARALGAWTLVRSGAACLLAATALWFFGGRWLTGVGVRSSSIAVLYLSIWGSSLIEAWVQGALRFRFLALTQVSRGLVQLPVLFITTALAGADGGCLAYAAGNLAATVPWFVFWLRRGSLPRMAVPPELRWQVWSYAAVIWLGSMVSYWVWNRAELFFLERWSNAQEIGFFAAGGAVAALVGRGPALLTMPLQTHFAARFGRDGLSGVRPGYMLSTKATAALAVPIAFVCAVLADRIMGLLYGSLFAGAIEPARIQIAAVVLSVVLAPGAAAIYGVGRPGIHLANNALGVLLVAVTCFILVPRYGAVGAAWARLAVG